MGKRPLIGLTMRLELETRRFYLGRDYSEALEAVGGIPVHIPLIADREYLRHIVAGLDGILLPGSDTDVDPAYFGEGPHPKLGRVIPEKDLTDRIVLEEAERSGKPLLAICYGMQALNVFRGGDLYQDLGSQVQEALKHQQGMPLERGSHHIEISTKGLLARISKESRAEKVKVNSHHHQAIRSLGSGLTATAWASDGIVECIEGEDEERFVLGVQWHPELSWRTDVMSKAIFERFVQACDQSANGPSEAKSLRSNAL